MENATARKDYEGTVVHVLQVGLGTFATFLHGDAGWLRVLLEASTRRGSCVLRGIGVDPVQESAWPLQRVAELDAGAASCLASRGPHAARWLGGM